MAITMSPEEFSTLFEAPLIETIHAMALGLRGPLTAWAMVWYVDQAGTRRVSECVLGSHTAWESLGGRAAVLFRLGETCAEEGWRLLAVLVICTGLVSPLDTWALRQGCPRQERLMVLGSLHDGQRGLATAALQRDATHTITAVGDWERHDPATVDTPLFAALWDGYRGAASPPA